MISIKPNPDNKLQVGAYKECVDLCNNGYQEVFAYDAADWWMIKLRHSRNGRTLVIQWRPTAWWIQENGKIIKIVNS